jgi:hypothetical protein
MKKRGLLILVGVTIAIGSYLLGRANNDVVHAQSIKEIKRSFGKCVGVFTSGSFLGFVFEDANGVVRVVNGRDGLATTEYDRD